MRNLFGKTIVALASVVLMNTNVALADVASGSAITTTFAGTGCAAGPQGTEYASNTYTFTPPASFAHGVLHHGDAINQTVTFSLASAVASLPTACDGIALTMTVTPTVTALGSNLTFNGVSLGSLGSNTASTTVTVGQLKAAGAEDLTLSLVVDTGNSTDMAQAINYSIPVAISLVANAN